MKSIICSETILKIDVHSMDLGYLLQGALLYNEYVVYNVDQIRMRYLVQVEFKYR